MSFYVGQKVVCVDAATTNTKNERELVEGNVYTVAQLTGREGARCLNDAHKATVVGVRLVEVKRSSNTPFASSRFRPLIERKTDISVFTALLNSTPTKTKQPERVF